MVAGVCNPVVGCRAVSWRLCGALLRCVFLWVSQGSVGFVGLLSMVDVASAPCVVRWKLSGLCRPDDGGEVHFHGGLGP